MVNLINVEVSKNDALALETQKMMCSKYRTCISGPPPVDKFATKGSVKIFPVDIRSLTMTLCSTYRARQKGIDYRSKTQLA